MPRLAKRDWEESGSIRDGGLLLLMVATRGGRRKGHHGSAVASNEDEEIMLGRGANESEMDARARGRKGR